MFSLLWFMLALAHGEPALWLAPDFSVVKSERHAFSPLALTSGCRDQIAGRICLVKAESMGEAPENRVCEPGGDVYVQDLLALYDRFPTHLQKMFCFVERIFIEQDPGSIAYASIVVDAQDKPTGGLIGIGQAFMDGKYPLDVLLSWKEQLNFGGPVRPIAFSPNLPHAVTSLNADFTDTLYYVVAHEFGHLFDFANHLNHQILGAPAVDSWTALSWAGYRTPLASESFDLRKGLCFYSCGTSSLQGTQQDDLFRELGVTNFTSTYSATNPYEDFAETFALYTAHTERGATFQFVTGTQNTYDLMDKLIQPIMNSKVDYIRKFLSGPYLYPGQP